MTAKTKIFNFTKAAIEDLPPAEKKKRDIYYDAKIPHLCLRVTDTGAKSFVVIRWSEDKTLKRTLGRFPAMTIEQARKAAETMNASISQGIDPLEEKRARRNEPTFGELFDVYLAQHLKVHCKSWEEMEAIHRRYLKPFANRKIGSMSRAELQRYHSELGQKHGHTTANRAIELIRAVINKARSWGLVNLDNPAMGIEKFKLKSRKRFLRGDELPRFFEALSEEEDITRDFFLMCLLTGARKTNVLQMKWDQISSVDQIWHIPDTKNGESQDLPLVPEAMQILERRKTTMYNEYVFPSFGKCGHLVEVKRAWDRVMTRADIKDLRVHDLRRTLGSWQATYSCAFDLMSWKT